MVQTILRAAAFAARAHAPQHRKGAAGTPYINHPLAVAEMVATVTAEEAVLVAALLHDVLEDTEVTEAEIGDAFGPGVLALVLELTDAPDWTALPLGQRKAAQAAKFRTASAGARIVKIADQTANLLDLAAEPSVWPPERHRAYREGAIAIVAACRDAAPALAAGFDAAAEAHARATAGPEITRG